MALWRCREALKPAQRYGNGERSLGGCATIRTADYDDEDEFEDDQDLRSTCRY